MNGAAWKNRETCFGRSFIKKFRVFWLFLYICRSQIVRGQIVDNWQQSAACTQNTLARHFRVYHSTHLNVARDTGSRCLARTPFMYYPHDVVSLILFDAPHCILHLLFHLSLHSFWTTFSSPMWVGSMRRSMCTSTNEELGTLAENKYSHNVSLHMCRFFFVLLSLFSWFIRLLCCSLTVTSRPIRTRTSLTPTSTWSCRTSLSKKRGTLATPHLHRELWLPGQVRRNHELWAQRVRQNHSCDNDTMRTNDLIRTTTSSISRNHEREH